MSLHVPKDPRQYPWRRVANKSLTPGKDQSLRLQMAIDDCLQDLGMGTGKRGEYQIQGQVDFRPLVLAKSRRQVGGGLVEGVGFASLEMACGWPVAERRREDSREVSECGRYA